MFLSIITVTKDDPVGLRRTIDSVDRQSFYDYEHIIVDGSHEKSHKQKAPSSSLGNRKVFRGKDRGIYDAMNIGLEVASGEYLLFLNGGDEFAGDVLSEAYAATQRENFPDLIGFRQKFLKLNGELIKVRRHNGPDNPCYLIPFWHQAIFIKSSVHKDHHYDVSMSVSGDHDLFLRILRTDVEIRYDELVLSCMYEGGVHQTQVELSLMESLETVLRNRTVRSARELNQCHYFQSLIQNDNLQQVAMYLGKRLSQNLRRISSDGVDKGLIWGNSITGRQLYSVSPESFIGFIDTDQNKKFANIPTFHPNDTNVSAGFTIICLSLTTAERYAFSIQMSSRYGRVYFLEDLI